MSGGAVGMQVRLHKDIDDVSKERKKRDKKFWESLSSHRPQRPRSSPPKPLPPRVARIPGDTELLQVDKVELKTRQELLK